MKKTTCLVLTLIIVGCSNKQAHHDSLLVDRPTPMEDKTMEEVDSMLKNWPFPGANGNWIPSRDGLENCDTIVDGFPYNHI